MRKTPGLIAAAAGVLVMLCVPADVFAQSDAGGSRVASLPPGTIHGLVRDESGAPIAGAVVSAVGSSSAFAVTDRFGQAPNCEPSLRVRILFARILPATSQRVARWCAFFRAHVPRRQSPYAG